MNTIRQRMARERALLLVGALAALSAALLLIVQTGLPQRATYTGQFDANGQLVAPELNAFAPPFELPTLTGQRLSLTNLRGKPVVLNFWATWCEPCRVEMPELEAVYQAHRADGLRIVAVNLGETPEVVREWVDTLGLTFDIVLDARKSLVTRYQLRGQPATYTIAPNGIITDIVYGPVSQDRLQAALVPYLSN